MKGIFIDNNIAKNFANPIDPNYKELINWLLTFDKTKLKEENAHLAVSQKLLVEYLKSSRNCAIPSSIPMIIGKLTREGRLNKISNAELRAFTNQYFTKKVFKKLQSNAEDHPHIATVLLYKPKICSNA